MESTTMSKRRDSGEDEMESFIDPEIWQELPKELLERVITKLPFPRLVAFRLVCKGWYSDVIPRAAVHGQGNDRAALIYFTKQELDWKAMDSKGSALWLQVGTSKSDGIGGFEEFRPSSFPLPRNGEDVQLMNSQEGLLFFTFVNRKDGLVREIVVCNPLTAQSRCLGLPVPLRSALRLDRTLLVGVLFDTNARSYSLVAAGKDGRGEFKTLLYNSSTSTWTHGPSMFSMVQEAGRDWDLLVFDSKRSVCSNGKLYWNIRRFGWLASRQYVIKFDIQNSTWKAICANLDLGCRYPIKKLWQMATYEEEILLWHLHRRSYAAEDDENNEFFDPNDDRHPQHIEPPCRSDREQVPDRELKFMYPYMIDSVEEYLAMQSKLDIHCKNYFAFSYQNCMYHALQLFSARGSCNDGPFLKIILHNNSENSYTELPVVPQRKNPGGGLLCPFNVWSFSPSLTSLV